MNSETLELTPEVQAAIKRYSPYLKEIQKHLLIVAGVFLAGATLGFSFYQKILTFIMGLFNLEGITIVLTSPYQFIDLAINTGIAVGTMLALPVIIHFFLKFIKPALHPKEYKILIRLVPISIFLFIFGFIFGFWIMNIVIGIFYSTTKDFNLNNLWDISHFFTQTLFMAVSLGIVFQFPIILTGLLRFKVLSHHQLVESRRYIYAGSLLFAALMPPTDLLSLTLITLPLIVFFELTLIFNSKLHLAEAN